MHQVGQNLKLDGSNYKIAIVVSVYHPELTKDYIENTIEALVEQKVKRENIKIVHVLGSLEIPYICKRILSFRKCDMIIALGIVIRGETSHFDLVSQTTYHALMKIQLESATAPVGFGVLTCETLEQAKERVSKSGQNKGKEVANSTLLQLYIVKNQL